MQPVGEHCPFVQITVALGKLHGSQFGEAQPKFGSFLATQFVPQSFSRDRATPHSSGAGASHLTATARGTRAAADTAELPPTPPTPVPPIPGRAPCPAAARNRIGRIELIVVVAAAGTDGNSGD